MNTETVTPVWNNMHKTGLAALLLVQFTAAYVIGTEHLLTNDSLSLILPIGITVAVPVALFLASYSIFPRFQRFVLDQDLRTLTMIQLWRVMGFTFLMLYSFEVLPGLFAWPAGLGDVAVGLAAIVVLARLDRDPDYALSPSFSRFHLLGLLDFAVAVATSTIASGAFPSLIPTGITSAPMDVWPLNLFPSFFVPAFIILHLTVLLKVREMRRQATTGSVGTLEAA